MTFDVVIIGGGAAGFFCAINTKEKNPSLRVAILEATAANLTKVKVSGGGRCNVTQGCFDAKRLIQGYPRGKRELIGPFQKFQPKDTVDWFRKRGIELVREPDGRMFPATNRSQSIIDCFHQAVRDAGVELFQKFHVAKIARNAHGAWEVLSKENSLVECQSIVVASGSSPTMSKVLKDLGQPITSKAPSLFTFKIKDPLIEGLAGQSWQDVELVLKVSGMSFRQRGPMLVTHWGLSGPAVLKLSAFAARELYSTGYRADLFCNFNPDMSEGQLRTKLGSSPKDFSPDFFNLSKRFGQRLFKVLVPDVHVDSHHWAKRDLERFVQGLRRYPFAVIGKGIFKEEFVTCGGVDLKSVDFKTMESKKFPGLYFAGEVLDVDGITGGYNFQNAWTTAWIASEALSNSITSC